jgi:RHS repeat-associated protein
LHHADGRRVQATVGTEVTNYLWDELSQYGDVVLETDASGAVEASYVLAGPELISQRRAGSTSYYYLHDAQGSVRGLADATPTVTDQYTYAAFGELVEQEGSTDNPYRYTGQQYDEASGLYSLRARYYHPADGRFLSRDPLEQWRNVRELNRYSYAASDPVNLSDATGLQALSEGGWLNTVVGLSTRVALKRFVGGMARGMLFAAAFYIIGVHVCGGRFAEELVKVGIWRVIAYGALFGGTLSMLGASPLRGARLLRGGIEMLIATTMGLKSISDLLGPEPNLCDLLMLFFAALLFRHGLGLLGEGLDMPPRSAGGQASEIAGQQEPCSQGQCGPTRPSGSVRQESPFNIRFSQTTAGGGERTEPYYWAMLEEQGWIGRPADVVRTPEGLLVSLDNTRLALARYLNLESIPIIEHSWNEPLPPEMMLLPRPRFGWATTWGEADIFRTSGQHPALPHTGTDEIPVLR